MTLQNHGYPATDWKQKLGLSSQTPMTLLRGRATCVEITAASYGDDSTEDGKHSARMQINGTSVRIELPRGIYIDEGDVVAVAGYRKDDTFKAIAYKNLFSGESGGGMSQLFFTLGSFGVAMSFPLIPLYIGAITLPLSLYLLSEGSKHKEAASLLAKYPVQRVPLSH